MWEVTGASPLNTRDQQEKLHAVALLYPPYPYYLVIWWVGKYMLCLGKTRDCGPPWELAGQLEQAQYGGQSSSVITEAG